MSILGSSRSPKKIAASKARAAELNAKWPVRTPAEKRALKAAKMKAYRARVAKRSENGPKREETAFPVDSGASGKDGES